MYYWFTWCAAHQASILVTGISADTTDATLKLFFESERINQGGRIAGTMDVNRDLKAAMVTFEKEEGTVQVELFVSQNCLLVGVSREIFCLAKYGSLLYISL